MKLNFYKFSCFLIIFSLIIIYFLPIIQGRSLSYNGSLCSINDFNNEYNGLISSFESNASIFIITIESEDSIIIEESQRTTTLIVNKSCNMTGSNYAGCHVTDGNVYFGIGSSGASESARKEELRYLRLKFGDLFNYTFDDRRYKDYEEGRRLFEITFTLNSLTLPPGKWHIVLSSLCFDLNQDYFRHNYKIWFKFSEECKDMKISTSEGGKIYGFYYPHYDANIVISKAWKFEFMLNGKVSFHINNTLLFDFFDHPLRNGFWNIRWNTPEGLKKMNMVIFNNNKYYIQKKEEGCLWDVGVSGDYVLTTSYLDYTPDVYNYASTPHLIALDVILP